MDIRGDTSLAEVSSGSLCSQKPKEVSATTRPAPAVRTCRHGCPMVSRSPGSRGGLTREAAPAVVFKKSNRRAHSYLLLPPPPLPPPFTAHATCNARKNTATALEYVDNALTRVLAHILCATATAISSRNPMGDPVRPRWPTGRRQRYAPFCHKAGWFPGPLFVCRPLCLVVRNLPSQATDG